MKLSRAFLSLPLLVEAVIEIRGAQRKLLHSPKNLFASLQNGASENVDSASESRRQVDRIAHAVRIAARLSPGRTDCLVQALAAGSMLGSRKLPREFYIGVAKPEEGLSAHAWLKSNDQLVVGGDISAFVPLVEPGTSRSIK